ncbi:MAG: hypothetical protein II187_10600 [Treponema sp.]|nr:hypothetical protein [Treponema sp.]
MGVQAENFADQFLRTYCNVFTARELEKYCAHAGIRVSSQEVTEYLETSPLVFRLERGRYLTKAGAFTGELFSIKPTVQEFDQRILIPGDRCLPFVDSEMASSALSFCTNERRLPIKTGEFDADSAIDMFMLFGEEYAPQYIAADPANSREDFLRTDFDMPNRVKLTGVDLTPLIEKQGMQRGDRLLCYVEDWNAGVVNVMVMHDGNNTFDCGERGERRLEWYTMLENALLESFQQDGPCTTIEEQLSFVFFEYREQLCVPDSGSVEEFLNRYAKKVGIGQFGVETRLWRKGEDVPAVGPWNSASLDAVEQRAQALQRLERGMTYFVVQPEVLDQYILDMYYHHGADLQALIDRIYPSDYTFHRGERAYVMLNMSQRDAILQKSYNWFSDQATGRVREEAVALMTKVNALMYRIDCCLGPVKDLPQQELVILSQLYSHLLRILQSVARDEYIEEDFASLMLSLEGMRWNFEDIEGVLNAALDEQHRSSFKVMKQD